MAPYRLTTFITGSPIVFQTAPPHPCSKALQTWYAELVGGADASQKGFGDLMPPQSMEMSAMVPRLSVERSGYFMPVTY
jgi:hypothetical protein